MGAVLLDNFFQENALFAEEHVGVTYSRIDIELFWLKRKVDKVKTF